jgi:hypothetical protein
VLKVDYLLANEPASLIPTSVKLRHEMAVTYISTVNVNEEQSTYIGLILYEEESLRKVNLHFLTDVCIHYVLMNSELHCCMSEHVVLVTSL